MARNIVAMVLGILVLGVVVAAIQTLSAVLFPLPAGLDPMGPDSAPALAEHASSLPAGAWAMAFGSELLGAFLGALVAGRVAGNHARWFAGGIVGLAFVGSLANWMAFPHPAWFMAGQAVAYPLIFLAVRPLIGRGSGDTEASAADGHA